MGAQGAGPAGERQAGAADAAVEISIALAAVGDRPVAVASAVPPNKQTGLELG